jgi:hypothetical protein
MNRTTEQFEVEVRNRAREDLCRSYGHRLEELEPAQLRLLLSRFMGTLNTEPRFHNVDDDWEE